VKALSSIIINSLRHELEGRRDIDRRIVAVGYVLAVEEQAQASTRLFDDADEIEQNHLEELFGKIMHRLFIGRDNREHRTTMGGAVPM
jgi:hypothetical protein